MLREHGALPLQSLRTILKTGYLRNGSEQALQPSSIDLTITDEAYELRGSCLPRRGEPIRDLLKQDALRQHDLREPLRKNQIYWIKLAESLALPPNIYATASNKSSSGRINLRGRLLADGVPRFDSVPAGYQGDLWLEVIPKSFSVQVHPGDRFNQLRLFSGEAQLNRFEHQLLFDQYKPLRNTAGEPLLAHEDVLGRGLTMTIDLSSLDIIGWQAKPEAHQVLDTHVFDHTPETFFDPVFRSENHELVLHPGTFYILATKEKIITPPEFATEMIAYDASKGEFRSHFAGFFDPGWGWRPTQANQGDIGVLEIEAYGHEFILRDGQPICLMVYEHMLDVPEQLYGTQLASNYQGQTGPRLAKWFKK